MEKDMNTDSLRKIRQRITIRNTLKICESNKEVKNVHENRKKGNKGLEFREMKRLWDKRN
jgi:hypothetical protein